MSPSGETVVLRNISPVGLVVSRCHTDTHIELVRLGGVGIGITFNGLDVSQQRPRFILSCSWTTGR